MGRKTVTHKNDIRFYRTLNELTLRQLAVKLGKDVETIAYIEQGKRSPTLETAWQISDFFGIPVTELFYRENDGELPPRKIVKVRRGGSLRSSIEILPNETPE